MLNTSTSIQQAKQKLLWFGFITVVATLPVSVLLIGLGVVYAMQQHWLLIILAVSLASITLVWLISQLWLRREVKKIPTSAQPLGHWNEYDQQVWQQQQPTIAALVAQQVPWNELPTHSLALVQQVAKRYGKQNEYAFSIPEALRLSEEISRRYRLLLLEHVPFIEQAKVSYFKTGIDNKKSIETGFKAYKFTFNAYRAFRTFNPIAALVGEARNLVLNQVGKKLISEADQTLKTALLEEVCSTAIDLYSGRFGELPSDTLASQPDPIRVCIIGQLSSGKSSLVNALCDTVNAEVSPLPSTEARAVFNCQLTDDCALHLCDLPGLDGSEKRQQQLFNEVVASDVVIWLLKANQSSRQLDTNLKAKLDGYYEQHSEQHPPLQIAVLNQIDLLLPKAQRQHLAGEPEAWPEVIEQAVDYNQTLLGLPVIPTSLADPHNPINLNSVLASIELQFEQALHTQLNRRRLGNQRNVLSGEALTKQWQRASALSKSLFNRVNQSVKK